MLFFSEQKRLRKIRIAWLRESRSDLYLFPGFGPRSGTGCPWLGLLGQAAYKNKNEVMIKDNLMSCVS